MEGMKDSNPYNDYLRTPEFSMRVDLTDEGKRHSRKYEDVQTYSHFLMPAVF